MEWPAGIVSPVAWLVIQEAAAGRTYELIAKGLGVNQIDLDEMAQEITGQVEGTAGDKWANAILVVKSVSNLNLHTAATGWDAIEAQAVNRIGEALNRLGDTLDPMKALEIAQVANKAVRRHNGEGHGNRTSIHVGTPGGTDMDLEIKSGHLGSVRLSLSARVRAQLETPRVIDGEVNREKKDMLSLTETRQLVENGR